MSKIIIKRRIPFFLIQTNFQRGDRELIGVKDMNVGYDSGWDRVLLLWPIIVRHVINEDSPLYGMSRENIVVCFRF